MAKPERLRITELSPGGDGVGHVEHGGDRRAVFLPRTAPGDEVEAAVDFGARPARGRVLSILTPSPSRVVPRCPVFDRCGGCDWMHLSAEAQREGHGAIVRRALAHVGL